MTKDMRSTVLKNMAQKKNVFIGRESDLVK